MNKTFFTQLIRQHGWLLFVVAQVVFFAAVGGATGWRLSERKKWHALPLPLAKPVQVAPTYDYPWIVSDEQLQTVLLKLRPAFRDPKPNIGNIDHALRFWGADAKFAEPQFVSGKELRELLLNHKRFEQSWGKDAQPLVVMAETGLQIRTQEGRASSSHVDHTLAALAEVGTPLTFRILPDKSIRSTRPLIVRDLLDQALRSFNLNQVEYEWSTMAFALYMPTAKTWRTSEGQEVSLDRLAHRIMRQTYNQGVCFGNHRLYTLTILLRIDETHSVLAAGTRQEILAHLQEATRRLVQSQFAQGYWDGTWSNEKAPDEKRDDQTLANKVLATGHALEWWAMAPVELHPPREVLVRAGQWLARTVGEMDDATVKKNYTYLSHAGRALAIWRGHEPAHFANQWLPTATTPMAGETPQAADSTPADKPTETTNAVPQPSSNNEEQKTKSEIQSNDN